MEENRSARHYTDNYYQAVAKRTPVVAALGPLLLRDADRRALHRLHPSNMSQIAPFDLAGGDDPYCWPPGPHGTRALQTTDWHGAHPLHPAHLVHDVHHLRPMQNHTTRNA